MDSQEKRRRLRVVDAKAACRAWSRRRLLASLASAMLALSLPAFARAEEAVADAPAQAQVIVVSAAAEEGAVDQASPLASSMASAASEETPAASAEPAETATPSAEQEAPAAAETPATASETSKQATPATDQAAPDTVPAQKAAEADVASASPTSDAAGPEAPAEAAPAAESQAATSSAIISPAASATASDTLGTTVAFDYDRDGDTDADDWAAFVRDLRASASQDLNAEHDYTKPDSVSPWEWDNGHIGSLASLDDSADVSGLASYYLTNIGQATSVKNQGAWNDCWGFATISALESAILKAQDRAAGTSDAAARNASAPKLWGLTDRIDLSELYYVWRVLSNEASGTQTGEGMTDAGVNPQITTDAEKHLSHGGFAASFAEAILGAWEGIATEKDQPYYSQAYLNWIKQVGELSGNSNDHFDSRADLSKGSSSIAHVNGIYHLPDPTKVAIDAATGNVTYAGHDDSADRLIKQALVRYGAVAIDYVSSGDGYYSWSNGARYNDTPYPTFDHAITIVGWDDNFGASRISAYGNDVSGLRNGAWLCKNSWGSTEWYRSNLGKSWAYNGYGIQKNGYYSGFFWLSYYDHTIFNPTCFSVDIASDGYDYDNNYSYDLTPSRNSVPYALHTSDPGTQVANVFTARGNETLRAVSAHTSQSSSHAHIAIYLVDEAGLADNDPTNDGAPVATMECDLLTAGLHTVALPSPVKLKAGQRFAVVETITNAVGESVWSWLNLETGHSTAAQVASNYRAGWGTRYSIRANAGETYARLLTSGGYRWLTPAQLTSGIAGGQAYAFGSALVKAYTTSDDAPKTPTRPVTPSTPSKPTVTVTTSPMYRCYNPNSGEHFYTANSYERDHVVSVGWRYEGIGWYAPSSGSPVHRLYNPNSGDHHYTLSAGERDWLVSLGWRYEGVGWRSDAARSVPLYRLYNPNAQKAGAHHYTTSKLESDYLVGVGWSYEGIGWYGVRLSGSGAGAGGGSGSGWAGTRVASASGLAGSPGAAAPAAVKEATLVLPASALSGAGMAAPAAGEAMTAASAGTPRASLATHEASCSPLPAQASPTSPLSLLARLAHQLLALIVQALGARR